MLDIHSHILPNIDDGSTSESESISMLKIAIKQGVTTQVLTPHIYPGRFDNTPKDIVKKFKNFKEHVNKIGLNIKLLLGAELHLTPHLITLAKSNNIPCLGKYMNKSIFLLEFPRNNIPVGYDNLIKWLIVQNYIPLIAHPERNTPFRNNIEKLYQLIELGCPIQLTAGSLMGKFGLEVQQFSEKLLLTGKVSCIASDCHNLKGRKPDLLNGFHCAEKLVGTQKATMLIKDFPEAITAYNPYHE